MTPGKKRVTLWISILALAVVVGTALAYKERIVEELLLRDLQPMDGAVHRRAAARLGKMRSHRAVRPLARILTDGSWGTDWDFASRALIRIGPRRVLEAFQPLDPPDDDLAFEALNAIFGMCGQEPGTRIEGTMLEARECMVAGPIRIRLLCAAFAGVGPEDAPLVMPMIREGLRSPDTGLRIASVDLLGGMEDAALPHVPRLIAFLSDSDEDVRFAAKQTLVNIGFRTAPLLIEVLRHNSPEHRQRVAEILGRMWFIYALTNDKPLMPDGQVQPLEVPPGAVKSMEALITTLRDDEPSVRAAAAKALYEYGDREIEALPIAVSVARALRDALRDPDTETRAQAARAIGVYRVEQGEAVAALVAALEDAEPSVRREAAQALGYQARAFPREVFAALLGALEDRDASVRETAVDKLGRFTRGTPVHLAAIEKLAADDPDEDVRRCTLEAIQEIKSEGRSNASK